jgi:uncharacterized protein YneF (UPF0154 family)
MGRRLEIGTNMANLPLIIGVAMIVAGLGLGVFITIRIVEQRRLDRDETLD